MFATGKAPSASWAARLALCVFAAFALLVPAAAASAETAATDGTGATADPGETAAAVAEQYTPQEAYADSLFSRKAAAVQHVEATVGDTLLLSGDFHGGWGSVTFTWTAVQVTPDSGFAYGRGDTGLLGTAPQGVYADAGDGLLSTQAVSDGQYEWRYLDSVTLPGQLPYLNKAVVPNGLSQTLELSDLQAGNYALCLTAADEVGDVSSIYWDVAVQGAGSTAEADTNVHLILDPTSEDAGTDDGGSSAGSRGDSSSATQRNAVWRAASKWSTASASAQTKGSFPVTGDLLGVPMVVLGAALVVAAAALAALAAVRARRRRRPNR